MKQIANLKIEVDFIEYDIDRFWGIKFKINDGKKTRESKIVYIPKWDDNPIEENIFKMINILYGPSAFHSSMATIAELNKTFGKEIMNGILGYDNEKTDMDAQRFADLVSKARNVKEYNLE